MILLIEASHYSDALLREALKLHKYTKFEKLEDGPELLGIRGAHCFRFRLFNQELPH